MELKDVKDINEINKKLLEERNKQIKDLLRQLKSE
jgi:hypothetical protein